MAPGARLSAVSTPGDTVPNSQLVTAFFGTGLACAAITSASFMVAIGIIRLVSQPHARSRVSTRATVTSPFSPVP